MDGDKFFKLFLKWFLFIFVSSVFAHSLIAYFSGSDELIRMVQAPPKENWSYFVIVTFVTAVLAFDFGWFREQFCIIMCPYGRFQSVLLDQHSVTVAYNAKRGEPRKGLADAGQSVGDCVACNRCVQVCPTGIDIRNGTQLECVACTACIDACDEIMEKVGKPKGLIAYRPAAGNKAKPIRPRTLAYAGIIALCVVGLVYSLGTRMAYSVAILRAKATPYQMLQNNQVMNHFKAHLLNQSHSPQVFRVELPPELAAQGVQITQALAKSNLPPGGSQEVHLFVTFPKAALDAKGELPLQFIITEESLNEVRTIEVRAVGPYSSTGS